MVKKKIFRKPAKHTRRNSIGLASEQSPKHSQSVSWDNDDNVLKFSRKC